MNWEFIIKYLPMYERAALLTVKLGLAGVICAIIVGLICAIIQYEKVPVARQIVAVYIELSRNTPLLVQLFFIYYGLPKIGIQTDPQTCGIAGLTFLGGSYMAEAFRSGLETVAAIQTESALSLGMNRLQVMRYVVLPQAFSISVPAFMANVIFLLKETSVFSAVSLMEPYVYRKRLNRTLLQDNRKPVFTGSLLSVDLTSNFDIGKSLRKEAALCRIWGLVFY